MTLAPTQIAQAAYDAGFRGQSLQWMTQIAMRESGGNPGAYNGNVKTGDNSWGLWQINTLGGNGPGIRRILQSLGHSGDFQDLTNPAINAQVAYKLSSGGTNFEPWRSHSPGWEGPQGFLTNTQQYAAQASQAAVQVQMGKASQTTNFVTMAQKSMTNTSSTFGSLVGWLNQQVGKPYQFGSVGPNTFDCSGLVTAAYKQLGINLPALTFSQKEYGAPVSFDKMQPGDLIFKHGAQGDFGHVGVYIGGGQVIDAPHTGATVRVTSVDNWNDAQSVRRIVDAQGRVITGAGVTPTFGGNVSTVPFSQATMDPGFDLTAQGDPMSAGSTDTGSDQQFRSALNLQRDAFRLPGLGSSVSFGTQQGTTATDFNTPLSSGQEAAFQQWKNKYAPNDSGDDYDFRGAFLAGVTPDPISGHWPDTFKKPNEPTFSNQSQYASAMPGLAGSWSGDNYTETALHNLLLKLNGRQGGIAGEQ